jgi:cytochrome c5
MKIQKQFLLGVILYGSLGVWAQAPLATTKATAPATQPAKKTAAATSSQDPGEKKFQQNCSRCHNAPEVLPRRITGTVLLHMRVRASLSAEDERLILHYMAP